MRMLITAAVACVLAAAAPAQLDLHIDTQDVGDNLLRITFTLQAASEDEAMVTFDGRFFACGSGEPDVFVQQWPFEAVQTPTLTTVVPIDQGRDTHFLFEDAELLTIEAPNEDGPTMGTYLRGTFGLKPEAVSITQPLAQLVIPADRLHDVGYEFVIADGQQNATQFAYSCPEPASACLLALAGPMLLARRKRLGK